MGSEPVIHYKLNMDSLDTYLALRSKRISPNYLRDTSTVLRAYQSYCGQPLDQHTSAAIQQWLESRRVQPSTVVAYAFTLRQFFAWAQKTGQVLHNPAASLQLPRTPKPFRRNFVDRQTVARLIDTCSDQELKFILLAGFHAGLRFGEVVQSQPHWFNLQNQTLSVLRSSEWDTKDHTDRDIPLTNQFTNFLISYGLRSPFMIAPNKLSARRHRYRFDFKRRFQNYVARQNVAITFHDCRRTFASLHVQAGTSIYKVARWLGDDVDVVSRHYGHLNASDPEVNRAFI